MIRIYLLRGITIVMASIFLYKLLDLQVINTSYQTLSENNAVLELLNTPKEDLSMTEMENCSSPISPLMT